MAAILAADPIITLHLDREIGTVQTLRVGSKTLLPAAAVSAATHPIQMDRSNSHRSTRLINPTLVIRLTPAMERSKDSKQM
jgi:hypothetical protein